MILQKHGRNVFQENQTQKIPKHTVLLVIYLNRISGNGWILDAFVIYHPQVGGFLFEILSPELTFFFNGIEAGVGEILKIHPYVCINMYLIYIYIHICV